MNESDTPIEQRPQRETIPWEDKDLGFWASFWKNWVEINSSAQKFFSRMPRNREMASPFFFFIVSFSIYFIIQLLLSFFQPSYGIQDFIKEELIIAFPFLLVTILLISTIMYFFIFIFGVRERWRNVFRVVCYSVSAIILFGVIPFFLGVVIGFIWGTVVIIIAIQQVFKLSLGKTGLIYFLSLFTFILFMIGLFFVLRRIPVGLLFLK